MKSTINPDIPAPVEQPRRRGAIRRAVGREFYVIKRRLRWIGQRQQFAREVGRELLPHIITSHRSFLLRPLSGVDMELQVNKITNLRLALASLDRLVIHPGQTFSLWYSVGRPTRTKGYLDGLVLQNGAIGRGVGGGLCQLGNLLYWMTLHTPLDVIERWRHSYDVFPDVNRTLPFGSGATLSYNYVDLQIANNTPHTFQLHLWLDESWLNGAIHSDVPGDSDYTLFESDHHFRQQWWGGYTRHNRIWRRIRNRTTGDERTELVTENHAVMMYEPLLEGGRVDLPGEITD